MEEVDKNQIYELLALYLAHRIEERIFCEEFYRLFDIGIESEKLSSREEEAFSKFSEITSRFTDIEEDHEKYPGVCSTREEVRAKVEEIRSILDDEFPTFQKHDL